MACNVSLFKTKTIKDKENKIHEELYNNIYLLTLMYQTSKEFDHVFKKDMFTKNNKAGFHQVIYYLLHILNPNVMKQKLPSWPPLDIRSENQFRNEVMKYSNELNSIYENANIPTVLTSHLISPGGYKFVKFMLKISQLVLYEHLKEAKQDVMLTMIKPTKSKIMNKRNISHLGIIHTKIHEECDQIKSEFNLVFASYKEKAESMKNQLQGFNKSLPALRNEVRDLKESNTDIDIDEIDLKLEGIKKKVNEVNDVRDNFVQAQKLLNSLLCKENLLEYKPGEYKIPQEISHLINPYANQLNLFNILESFILLMERKFFQIKPIDASEVTASKEKYESFNEELEKLLKKLHGICDHLTMFKATLNHVAIIKKNKSKSLDMVESVESLDSVLAVPLLDTPPRNRSILK
ncbi:PREDICTED: uncharacterized protein LOC108558368 [Nicrophorus vespilloides]|uniref:Uncharacterized protein LOC108558368 n=1 Tax=Nicrophorus vespilloides TaxID=110193 RepID=A0ABM1M852_NICVS|nr:PREDICTED: uncharacterized protein LOC108558368 [Nicrophorus vespilloides]